MKQLLLSLAIIVAAATPALAQDGGKPTSLGVLHPSARYTKEAIMVAPFNVDQGVEATIETMPRIIRKDLDLTGLFTPPPDQRLANAQNLQDGRTGIDFDAWARMNVEFYAMGRVSREGDTLKVRLLLYSVSSRKLIIERIFSDSADQERRLAHRISDEIVAYAVGFDGVARTKHLFVNEEVPGKKEIAVMDWDGFAPKRLTNYNSISSSPEWGANGTEIYFGSYRGNRGNIYGMQLSTGQTWTIAAYGGTNHSPSWSPTARRIAMVLSKDGNSEIYTCGRDGSDLRRVTTSAATEGSPSYSPDGKLIAYVSNEAGGVHIFTMNPDGSGKRRVTPTGSWNDAPSWSPDGRRIVFTSRSQGVSDIYIADITTNPATITRLTQGQGQNGSPSFAPNGHHVSFTSDRSGQWQVYIMLDDGSNQRALTTSGRNTNSAWSPQPPSTD